MGNVAASLHRQREAEVRDRREEKHRERSTVHRDRLLRQARGLPPELPTATVPQPPDPRTPAHKRCNAPDCWAAPHPLPWVEFAKDGTVARCRTCNQRRHYAALLADAAQAAPVEEAPAPPPAPQAAPRANVAALAHQHRANTPLAPLPATAYLLVSDPADERFAVPLGPGPLFRWRDDGPIHVCLPFVASGELDTIVVAGDERTRLLRQLRLQVAQHRPTDGAAYEEAIQLWEDAERRVELVDAERASFARECDHLTRALMEQAQATKTLEAQVAAAQAERLAAARARTQAEADRASLQRQLRAALVELEQLRAAAAPLPAGVVPVEE